MKEDKKKQDKKNRFTYDSDQGLKLISSSEKQNKIKKSEESNIFLKECEQHNKSFNSNKIEDIPIEEFSSDFKQDIDKSEKSNIKQGYEKWL